MGGGEGGTTEHPTLSIINLSYPANYCTSSETNPTCQNVEDADLKRKAIQASAERRQLRELRAKMERERRKRERLKRVEIAQYRKARGELMDKEVTARMLRRPMNWEIKNAGDVQRRRHEVRGGAKRRQLRGIYIQQLRYSTATTIV